MKKHLDKRYKKAQTAIEYMMLLAAVVAIVLIGFNRYLPVMLETGNIYFNRVSVGILGDAPKCGDGYCNSVGAPAIEDCDSCRIDCCP